MHRTVSRSVAAALLAGVVLLAGGCGDDSPEGGSPEEFCAALDTVKVRGQELSDADLVDDSDVPEVKERLLALIDAFDEVIAAAPEEIREEADEISGVTAQIRERVEAATTEEEIREEVPLMVSVLADSSNEDDRISAPIIAYAQEECGY